MRVRRQTAAAAVTGIIAALTVWPAVPASAHGAPSSPASRAFACRPEAPTATSAACVAAVAATGRALGSWDNLRVPGINGRDQQFVPDGQLCSASLPEFRGLDLARADWPATAVTAGAELKIHYMSTIPHAGRFRVYMTGGRYDGAVPLRWSDLDLAAPLVDVTDPPRTGDVYTLAATVPPDRTGRHLLYTVWQNTSTPDTYYSCSDVDVRAAGGGGAAPPPPPSAGPPAAVPPAPRPPQNRPPGAATPRPPAASAGAVAPAPSGSAAGLAPVPPPPPVAADSEDVAGSQSWLGRAEPVIGDRVALGQQIMSAALIVLFGVTGGAALLRIRAARNAEGLHRRPGNR
jgi:chitin-binding protein